MSRVVVPLVAAFLALAGSLLATFYLYHSASSALARVLDAQLRGAGESAAQCLAEMPPDSDRLRNLMKADALEGAFLVDRSLTVVADATGPSGRPIDLLRVDPSRISQAFQGQVSTEPSYVLGNVNVASAYFPVRNSKGVVTAVLTLEAGQSFIDARHTVRHALLVGCALALVAALALAALAAGWGRAERFRRVAAERAARGDTMSKMAAIAAHEIRNPLMVIRGTIELMRERAGDSISVRDRSALADVLGEVERLRRLTQDFLDLAADTPMLMGDVDLGSVLEEAARGCEAAFPQIHITRVFSSLPSVVGDATRLRQVLANLLTNAAQAQLEGEIDLIARVRGDEVSIRVHDRGPGVPRELRPRLFEPLMTRKAGGTGLGLALSRQIVERHGGRLRLVDEEGPGATFEVLLPVHQESSA